MQEIPLQMNSAKSTYVIAQTMSTIRKFAFILLFVSTTNTKNTLTTSSNAGNRNNVLPCATIFCDSDLSNNDCQRVVNECLCSTEWTIICPKFTSKKLDFTYNKYSRLLKISGDDTNEDFDSAIQYFLNFIEVTQCVGFTFTNFCKSRSRIDDSVLIENSDVTSVISGALNLSLFVQNHNFLKLEVSNNCFHAVQGTFRTVYPTIQELDLSYNLLDNLTDDVFFGLHSLETLKLNNNRIQEVNLSLFQGMTSLVTLLLDNNGIQSINEGAFNDLTELTMLDLSSNRIQILHPFIFRNLTNIEDLKLNFNNIQALHSELFKDLLQLRNLELAHNHITNIPADIFTTNYRLISVDLTDNQFFEIPTLQFGSFDSGGPPMLSFRHNNITSLQIPITKMPGSQKLDLSGNCIVNIQPVENVPTFRRFIIFECSNCCLELIHPMLLRGVFGVATLSYNNMKTFDMEMLRNLYSINVGTVDLSDNKIERIDVTWDYPLLQNSANALSANDLRVGLQNNHVVCDCHIYSFLKTIDPYYSIPPPNMTLSNIKFDVTGVTCKEPTELVNVPITSILQDKILHDHLVCNFSVGCPKGCHCFHRVVQNVNVINCNSAGLKDFPIITNNENTKTILHLENNNIQDLPSKNSPLWNQIQELYLTNNTLSSLENLTITSTLHVLYLRQNNLKHLDPVLLNLFEPPEEKVLVSLSENPWACNCDWYKLKSQMFLKENVVDFAELTCLTKDQDAVNIAKAADYDLCPELIPSHIYLKTLLPTFVSFFILVCLCVILVYKYKPEIQHWMFIHNMCLPLVTEEDIDTDKRYDAFVSYSALDEEWVADHLVPELEGGTPPYELCLHSRDWLVGEWIPEQIFRSVEESRRTIIVLTDNFLESVWSRLEFHAAYRQALTDHVNRVLIVVPGEMPDLMNMDHELRAFVELNTYIKWKEAHFWRKLRCAMPRVKPVMQR